MELATQLARIGYEFGVGRLEEPLRLFNAKEYRAAVISALTLLETTLRERLAKNPLWPNVRRPLALRSLIKQAIDEQVLKAEDEERIASWMRTRNEVVHSSMQIGRAEAKEIVEGVLQVIRALSSTAVS